MTETRENDSQGQDMIGEIADISAKFSKAVTKDLLTVVTETGKSFTDEHGNTATTHLALTLGMFYVISKSSCMIIDELRTDSRVDAKKLTEDLIQELEKALSGNLELAE